MLKEISIEIIRKCPSKCLHCSSNSNIQCSEMISLAKYQEIVDGALELGVKTICFSGGEPFLHPNIVEMVKYASNRGLLSYIYSSGIYQVGENVASAIPDEIFIELNNKITKIIFNIEAADEEIYDSIMGTHGYFKFLTSSIRKAVASKITVEGHFVPMKLNMHQIGKVLQYCQELGVSKVSFLRLVIHGRALENKDKLSLSSEDLVEIKTSLLKIRSENSFNIRIGVPLLGETYESRCEAADGKLNIKYDGKVYPCEVFKNNRIQILDGTSPGNIYDNSIQDIYNKSEYLIIVRGMVKQFSCNNYCENCVGQYYINREVENSDGK